MPATLREEPLGIACVFSNGTRAEFSLCGLPEPELARDLLIGLIELIHPHGSLDSTGSLLHFAGAIRAMVRTLSKQGFSGGAGRLDPRQLTEYWMGASVGREACTRRMLQGFDLSTGGLSAPVRELAAGRAYNPQAFRRPLPPYPEMEWASLTETCRSIIDASLTTHRNALADAEGGEDPASGGWTQQNVRWLGAQRGPLATAELAAHIGRPTLTTEMRRVSYLVTTELFPSLDVVIAYRLAFGIYSGIVAAHETTANAAANAIRLLLENWRVWEEICSDPGLIPNAVEECLRYSPSIVAWRRLVLRDTVVGGSAIPAGAKLLLVQASANHDGRRFENPDVLDVWRENAGDHLSFGYGPHQCMGKNLARMELQIFLEELTTRLPYMELVPGQEFTYTYTYTYLPNISFRGPEHL